MDSQATEVKHDVFLTQLYQRHTTAMAEAKTFHPGVGAL